MGKRMPAAARILAEGNPLDTVEGRQRAREAITDMGLPLNERAINALIDKIADIFEPFFALAQTAAKVVEAGNAPSKRVERGGMNDDGHADDITEEQRREYFFNPDGDGEP